MLRNCGEAALVRSRWIPEDQSSDSQAEIPDLPFRTADEHASATPADTDWIASGLIAAGAISAKVKVGKTSWILAMVRSILDGKAFMGRETRSSPVVNLTEDGHATG